MAKVEFHFGELFPRVGFIVTNLETPSPECGALLRPARDGRAVDQERQAGRQDDAVILASLSVERGAALVERDRLQPREPVAAAGVAATD